MAANLETLANILVLGLLIALFLIFLKMWRQTRSSFSGGLTLFAAVLLAKQALTLLQAFERARNIPVLGARLQLLATLGEGVALAILLYVVAR